MKTRGTYGLIVDRQRDIDATGARHVGGGVKDSHLREVRGALTSSHRRRLANQAQFRTPHIFTCR